MACSKLLSQLKPFVPWICSTVAIGYAAYLHWRLCNLKKVSCKTPINDDKDNMDRRHEVNIDTIDRNAQKKKRISYCRCWKSTTFPLCDGIHKNLNKENDDSVGPLVLVWEDDKYVPVVASEVANDNFDNMDIKSIDSESPILQSSNGDSNGEFEKMDKLGDNSNISSDDHLSSIEVLNESFSADSKDDSNDDDFDEDTVKLTSDELPKA